MLSPGLESLVWSSLHKTEAGAKGTWTKVFVACNWLQGILWLLLLPCLWTALWTGRTMQKSTTAAGADRMSSSGTRCNAQVLQFPEDGGQRFGIGGGNGNGSEMSAELPCCHRRCRCLALPRCCGKTRARISNGNASCSNSTSHYTNSSSSKMSTSALHARIARLRICSLMPMQPGKPRCNRQAIGDGNMLRCRVMRLPSCRLHQLPVTSPLHTISLEVRTQVEAFFRAHQRLGCLPNSLTFLSAIHHRHCHGFLGNWVELKTYIRHT